MKVETPIDRIPIFVKAGAIIPVADGLVYAEQEPEKPVQIIVYPGADGEFVLYEDEAETTITLRMGRMRRPDFSGKMRKDSC